MDNIKSYDQFGCIHRIQEKVYIQKAMKTVAKHLVNTTIVVLVYVQYGLK